MSDRDQIPNRVAVVTLFCILLFVTTTVWHEAITFDPPFVRFDSGRGDQHDNPIHLGIGAMGFLIVSSPFLAGFHLARGKVGASRRDMLLLGSAGIMIFAVSMGFLVAAIKSYYWCDWEAFSATVDSDTCFVWRYDEADRSLNHSALSR